MSGEFLANYISTCMEEGIASLPDICASAESRIKEIDEEIKKIEVLRTEKIHLHTVIRNLGGGKQQDKTEYIVMDFSIPEDKLDPRLRNLCISICNFIDRKIVGIKPSHIIEELASLEENAKVYSAIKWLAERDIVTRNKDRDIVKGSNWTGRPIASN